MQGSSPAERQAILYDQDFLLWLEQTASQLREGRLADLDAMNLLEEIESMGRSEKQALESNLEILLMHLLKYRYQPNLQSNSWRFTIREHRSRIDKALKASPSLKRHLEQEFANCYQTAIELAAAETGLPLSTFPEDCPFKVDQTLNPQFLPDAEASQ
jgi:hypothetical protein